MLSFTVREDVAARASFPFQVVGGTPLLEVDSNKCRLPLTVEVIGS